MDAPGRPTMYETSPKFLKMFGLSSLDELPELPRYKLDENQQIVIDEYVENVQKSDDTDSENSENSEENIDENETNNIVTDEDNNL